MANYCENTLRIHGDKKDIKRMLKKAGEEFSLEKLYPVPKEITQANQEYDWCVKNYGCKWLEYPDTMSMDTDGEYYIEATFDTPWSPPVEWMRHVSALYPTLSMKLMYHEDGAGFMGVAKAQKGRLEDQNIDY